MFDELQCPRCGGDIPSDELRGAYPGALSRWDNETEVCSDCGTGEALIQWFASRCGVDPHAVVHPTKGLQVWVGESVRGAVA